MKSEYIVLGAHYDHLGFREGKNGKVIFNGADDNATGVATIIETARYLNAHQSGLKRSVIIVAFDAEESGLIGSEFLLAEKIIDPENVKFMFSIDMVGMYSSIGSVRMPGIKLIKGGEQIAQTTAQKNNIIISKTNKTKVALTDTKSFLDYGIPASHMFTGLKSPYHKPEDTAEKLDYEGMDKICSFLNELTLEVANQPELTPHRKATEDVPLFTFGGSLGIGSSRLVSKDAHLQTTPRFAIEPGLNAQIRMTRSIFLQPEINYDFNGYWLNNEKLNLQSITTPVSIMLKTYNNDPFTPKLFVLAGGYYSYHVYGKIGNESIDFNSEFNKEDYGLNLGFGFEIYKARFSCTFRNSWTSLIQDPEDGNVNRSNFRFKMGWRL